MELKETHDMARAYTTDSNTLPCGHTGISNLREGGFACKRCGEDRILSARDFEGVYKRPLCLRSELLLADASVTHICMACDTLFVGSVFTACLWPKSASKLLHVSSILHGGFVTLRSDVNNLHESIGRHAVSDECAMLSDWYSTTQLKAPTLFDNVARLRPCQ